MKWLILVLVGVLSSVSNASDIKRCTESECVDYFKKYRQYAKRGYAGAMYGVADMYYVGYGTDPDVKKALKYFRRAAKYGSEAAMFKVGYVYLTDERIADYEQGMKYLKSAARGGHGDSAYIVGMIFYSKKFGEHDLAAADKWLNKAYELGNINVRGMIQHLYSNNELNEQDWPKLASVLDQVLAQQKELKARQPEPSNAQMTVNVALTKHENKSVKQQILWPEEEMETIQVSPPSLTDVFDYELTAFQYMQPEKYRVNTGSKLIGRTCEKTMSCSSMNTRQFKRVVDGLVDQFGLAMMRDDSFSGAKFIR